ncbi:MAG: lysophospholipid acyltransferase family protein [Pseudomonadota bacterium]
MSESRKETESVRYPRPGFMDVTISLFMWSFMLLITTIFIPWSIASILCFPLFDPHRKLQLIIHRTWCNWVAKIYPKWKYTHSGFDKLKKGQNYVVMSNHQSFADILLLSFLPITFRWTAKRAVFMVPLFGWQFWLGGHLSIVRGSEKSRRNFMKRAVRSLRSGISVLIFPEGTRSRTGEIGPFKAGGFVMAVRSGTPILPLVISGSSDALPKKSWVMIKKTYPVVRALDPIETKDKTEEDVAGMMKELRERMIEAKKQTDAESARLFKQWTGTGK